MWIIFKVFIEFVTMLPVVLCSGFWPWVMWDFSPPTRDWTHTLCNERKSLNHWTAREVPGSVSPFFFPQLVQNVGGYHLSEVSSKILNLWCSGELFFKRLEFRHFPCGPVAKTRRSQCRGPGFNPWSGNKIPHTITKIEDPTHVLHLRPGTAKFKKKRSLAYPMTTGQMFKKS